MLILRTPTRREDTRDVRVPRERLDRRGMFVELPQGRRVARLRLCRCSGGGAAALLRDPPSRRTPQVPYAHLVVVAPTREQTALRRAVRVPPQATDLLSVSGALPERPCARFAHVAMVYHPVARA